jgi:RimJ/RimL family protein N-acetyltransferase
MAAMPRTLDDIPWPRATPRLSLRRAEPADVEAVWAYRRLPEVSEWLTGAPSGFDEYATLFVDPVRLGQTIVVEHEGRVVGDLYVAIEDGWAQSQVAHLARGVQAEIGWVIAPEAQGRGFGLECARELLQMSLRDLGLRRVYAQCFEANTASWRLMERLGMRREQHTRRESLHHSGQWLDGVMYALLADEWSPLP